MGVAFAIPTVLLLMLLFAYPLVSGVQLSFQKTFDLQGNGSFVGLDNFKYLFTTGIFWDALWKGVIWTAGSVVLELVLGVGAALTLNLDFYGRKFARAIILLPYLAPVVVTALIWRWMFDVDRGLLNELALATGLTGQPLQWLSQMPLAMIAVILVGGWHFFPFTANAVLGRMQSIPKHLYEAAQIERAGRFAQFWDVTRPAIAQVVMTVLMFRVLWAFNDFATVYLLTGGGPVDGTRTLPVLIYETGFRQFNVGLAAAMSVLMVIILSVFLAVYLRIALKQSGGTR